MPTAEEVAPPPLPWTPLRVALTVIVSASLVYLIVSVVSDPIKLLFVAGWVLLMFVWAYFGGRKADARSEALAGSRSNASICAFAWDFDRRSVDPWVIRATWEEFQKCIGSGRGPFPIRASDRIEQDYGIPPDDLGDVWEIVVRRAGRSSEDTERNPYYARVETVGDFVHFTNSQPLQGAV